MEGAFFLFGIAVGIAIGQQYYKHQIGRAHV